jgi:hypothetical protein
MGTRATVATDGARVMVWMGEDEREIMVEGEGGMEEGASCATGMIKCDGNEKHAGKAACPVCGSVRFRAISKILIT